MVVLHACLSYLPVGGMIIFSENKSKKKKKKDEQTLGYDGTLFVGRSFRASKSSSNRCLQFESQVLPQRGKKPFL